MFDTLIGLMHCGAIGQTRGEQRQTSVDVRNVRFGVCITDPTKFPALLAWYLTSPSTPLRSNWCRACRFEPPLMQAAHALHPCMILSAFRVPAQTRHPSWRLKFSRSSHACARPVFCTCLDGFAAMGSFCGGGGWTHTTFFHPLRPGGFPVFAGCCHGSR